MTTTKEIKGIPSWSDAAFVGRDNTVVLFIAPQRHADPMTHWYRLGLLVCRYGKHAWAHTLLASRLDGVGRPTEPLFLGEVSPAETADGGSGGDAQRQGHPQNQSHSELRHSLGGKQQLLFPPESEAAADIAWNCR